MKRIALIPHMFVLLNWAAVVGLYYFIRGRSDVWTQHKLAGPAERNCTGGSSLL